MSVQFRQYDDKMTQAARLADLVAAQLTQAIIDNGWATLAVPGGSTPALFLAKLGQKAIDWPRIRVVLSDERQVPKTSPRSNARLLDATLFAGAARQAQFVPLYCENDPTPAGNARQKTLALVLPLDVAVLGMGADMHTASLFAGADYLAEALDRDNPNAVIALCAPGASEPRLSLTASVLCAAAHIHVLIAGRDKLAAYTRARQPGPATDAPVRAILSAPQGVTVHFTEHTEV